MSQNSIFWPVALIAVAAITLALILASIPSDPQALAISPAIDCPSDPNDPAYPACIATRQAEEKTATAQAKPPTVDPRIIANCPTNGPEIIPPYPPYNNCLQTRTALLQETERASWTDTPVPPPVQVQPSATRTPTATRTLTPTQDAGQSGEAQTAAETSTPSATRALPTPTIEDPAITAAAVACVPGETIIIEGSADPGMALIVTFGDRPVGGGFSRNDGSYRIRLHIGDERPGLYPVLVEERDSSATVQELLCRVPALTPTPTPPLAP